MDITVDQRSVIVFDLDDTLYNEITYLQSAYREIAKKIDPKKWRQLFATMFSLYRCSKNVFDFLAQEYNCDKDELLSTYRNHKPEIALFHGALPLLKNIREKSGKIGLITDGRSQTQRAKLQALGIQDLFDIIIISEEFGSEKPDIRNYLAIAEAFPDHTYCYIADNIRKDFIAPNQLGWETICLLDNGLNIHHSAHLYMTPKHLPSKFVTSLTELRVV
ncbi:HAD family hydrolase [Pseudozobellia thermophila]|uniref:Putative hydrolase of the HAD superfamily n=1 Tax=Pseudozobellia thermophila TaxID=192903 RepID=A0A1M6IWS3_9FLAO|nr:HAD family hydrolase [Pseudozobellia thermophila]SHJ38890.1 putative hydrolase of the HAD superfamily [Pseudozobellia thermophila]